MWKQCEVYVISVLILIKICAALDCKDVYYYHCPYDGKNIAAQAIRSNRPDQAIKIPTPHLGGWGHPWLFAAGDDPPGRILCSNQKDAFKWVKKDANGNLKLPSLKINSQYWFCADGLPVRIAWGYENRVTDYLRMDCELTSKESAAVVEKNSMMTWENYNLSIPHNAVKGGVDSPQNNKPFYIGLIKFHGETYLAKIIQDTTWLEIVAPNLPQPIYITSARDIKILCSDNQDSLYWTQVTTLDGVPITNSNFNNIVNGKLLNIYRCLHGLEHFLTRTPEACNDTKVEALVILKRFEGDSFKKRGTSVTVIVQS